MASLKFNSINSFTIEVLNFEPDLTRELRQLIRTYPLVILKKFQSASDDELLSFSSKLSTQSGDIKKQILHWDFGPIMRMGYQTDAKNYLFSAEKVPFHWDGAFYQEPQWLLFYCEDSNGVGGETLFTNTESIWSEASDTDKEIYASIQLTYETEKKAHYGGTVNVEMLQTHPLKQTKILRFAEEVETKLNPVSLHVTSHKDADTNKFVKKMQQVIYSHPHCYQHLWEKDDLVIADNFSLIHGRRELKANTERKFKRIQIL